MESVGSSLYSTLRFQLFKVGNQKAKTHCITPPRERKPSSERIMCQKHTLA